MSPKARRLTGSVATDRFHWQQSPAKPFAKPIALVFNESARNAAAVSDPNLDIEARQMQLPSVSEERLQTIEQEAFATGYASGERAAEADASRRLQLATEQLAVTVEEISGLRIGLMRRAERELIQLALAMAGRIVRREIQIDPDLLLVIARVAIDRLGERAAAVVHLNPLDHATLSTRTPDESGSISLVADSAIPRGGCRIESACGEIDAGIEAQVAELARELLSSGASDLAIDDSLTDA